MVKLTILSCCGMDRLVPLDEVDEFHKLCEDPDTTGLISEQIASMYPMVRTYAEEPMLVWKEGRFVLSQPTEGIMIHPSHTWLQNRDVEIIETEKYD